MAICDVNLKMNPGTDGVLALFKYLERKLLGKSPKNLSRTSSVLSFGCGMDR